MKHSGTKPNDDKESHFAGLTSMETLCSALITLSSALGRSIEFFYVPSQNKSD